MALWQCLLEMRFLTPHPKSPSGWRSSSHVYYRWHTPAPDPEGMMYVNVPPYTPDNVKLFQPGTPKNPFLPLYHCTKTRESRIWQKPPGNHGDLLWSNNGRQNILNCPGGVGCSVTHEVLTSCSLRGMRILNYPRPGLSAQRKMRKMGNYGGKQHRNGHEYGCPRAPREVSGNHPWLYEKSNENRTWFRIYFISHL